LDDLLDVAALGAVGATGYRGASEHALLAHYVAARMGGKMPPTMLWNPRGKYCGLTERRAALIQANALADTEHLRRAHKAVELAQEGRASILHYLMNFGHTQVLETWREYILCGGPIYDLNDTTASPTLEIPGGRESTAYSTPDHLDQSDQSVPGMTLVR